jgi:hypothetical protein
MEMEKPRSALVLLLAVCLIAPSFAGTVYSGGFGATISECVLEAHRLGLLDLETATRVYNAIAQYG